MADKTIRVITRASNGTLRTKDFDNFDEIEQLHDQVGIDDCSTDLSLRGLPVFRGLVGPMTESKTVVRYESPEVFECLTKEWSQAKTKRRRRRKTETAEEPANRSSAIPVPNMVIGNSLTVSSPTASV